MKTSDEELLEYKYHILNYTTDGEDGFNYYLSSTHVNIITDDLIICYMILDDYVSIYYMEAFTKQGYKECRDIGLELFEEYTVKQYLPVVYTGVSNLFKNNSLEIEPNVYQFMPKEYNIK